MKKLERNSSQNSQHDTDTVRHLIYTLMNFLWKYIFPLLFITHFNIRFGLISSKLQKKHLANW